MWFDGPLRLVDRVCLSSMVDVGMTVRLYTFGDVPNLPPGISVEDGRKVLDPKLIKRLIPIAKKHQRGWLPTCHFSDFFRIFQQKHDGNLWFDTDILMFRKFEYSPDTHIFAKESRFRMGFSVLRLPSFSPIIGEYQDLLCQPMLIPNWLGWRRGLLRPVIYRLFKKEFSPSDLGITIFANDALTRLTRRHRIGGQALPKASFYHWTGNQTLQIYRNISWSFFLDHSNHYGLHIHRKVDDDFKPEQGSLWSWAIGHYG